MFDLKTQNGPLDQMAEAEIFGFDSIVLKISFYLVSNICMYYGFKVLNRKMKHKSP